VNGAQGVVKKIWFDQGFNAIQLLLLEVIFVQFEGYSGPEIPGGKVLVLLAQLYQWLPDRRPKQENS